QNEIFSDRQSKAQYYKRLMTYSLPFALLFLIIGIDILVKGNVYMTEGLWDMNGSLFWKALVFETPFALLRLLPTIFFIGMGIVLVACGKTVEDADKYTSSIEDIAIPDDVSIVGLGEATHGNVEFQDLKKDVFQVLIEKEDIRAFVIEGDFGGAQVVDTYIA